MNKLKQNKLIADAPFNPDWRTPPGEILSEIMEDLKIEPLGLASKLGFSMLELQKLLQGELLLTDELALKLESALGGPPGTFWKNAERNYRKPLTPFAGEKP